MPVEYPEGPPPVGEDNPKNLRLEPGEGINATPPKQDELLDFGGPVGSCTGAYYGIAFQLPKWGFQVFKVDEGIFVSPVFKDYFNLTIAQRDELEAKIKAGLRSIGETVSYLELISHDVRKYKEFMDYFKELEEGKKLTREGKKEEGEKKLKRADQTLKSIFIDQVDAHTGERIALKSIAPRWPTIIADFMKLTDEDLEPEKIREKLKVSEAEGVILATKNKLYKEWRDELFRPTVEERYRRLFKLVEGKKSEVERYKENLKPTIARFRMISDALAKPLGPEEALKSFFRPDAQAYSIDTTLLWAWKPFAPSEKYKITRELPLEKIHASKAGFTGKEILLLHKELEDWDEKVATLPQEPSIDSVIRKKVIPRIEKRYGVKITAKDIYDARQMLVEQFEASYEGTKEGETWVYSPYYMMFEIPMNRTVLRFPDGTQMEGLTIKNLKGITHTQNLIISRCIELVARGKEMDQYINQLLGEYGFVEKEKTEELVEEKYPEVYLKEEEWKKREEEKKKFERVKTLTESVENFKDTVKKIRVGIGKFFGTLGWEVEFFRGEGPYEFAFYDRITKFYFPETGSKFADIKNFFKAQFKTPDVELRYI
jgi:hypothetical protein